MNEANRHPASWRDPSGFVFTRDGIIYRQVNKSYQSHFDQLISSGLYAEAVQRGWLIPHAECPVDSFTNDPEAYKILRPEALSFISFPYEWSFSMLKDAALLTIRLAKGALEKGMMLKDATPFNVQWYQNRMVFIDTLSFEQYEEGKPWIAYRQFCENFLGPLLLMHYHQMPLQQLQLAWPEGIPLAFIQKNLPGRSRWNLLVYLHIHVHARLARSRKGTDERKAVVTRKKLENLLNSLEALVQSLKLKPDTTWSHYYEEAATREDYLGQKTAIIREWISRFTDLKTGIDFGANEGAFARLLAEQNIHTIAADADAGAIDKLYQKLCTQASAGIHPMIIDLANPSPAMGLNHTERASFLQRIQNREIGLALALVHHLCIGRNIPFEALTTLFGNACKNLVIEFVPLSDSKTQQLLLNKKNNYPWYTEAAFTSAFSKVFRIRERAAVPGTERILFLMERISG